MIDVLQKAVGDDTLLSADTVIAVSATLIALMALVLSVIESRQNRKHNRLSVTPHLVLDSELLGDEPIRVIIRNTGIGPAFIRSMTLEVDKTNGHPATGAGWRAALHGIGLAKIGTKFRAYDAGDAVAVGASETVLFFPASHQSMSSHKLIMAALPRLKIHVRYSSVYGEEFAMRESPSMETAQ